MMRSLPLLLLILLCTACGPDTDPALETSIEGRWELQRAQRNRVETTTLDGLYFEFLPEGVLNTNMLGEDQTGSYRLEGETSIVTEDINLPLTYEVSRPSDTLLLLRARHQGFLFDFEMKRAPELAEEEGM